MKSMIVKSDFKDLDRFVLGLNSGGIVKVGIMGEKTTRRQAGKTNAEIGATHEFGSFEKNIPARSWLRMPIMHKQKYIVEDAGKVAHALLAKGNMKQLLAIIGHACENAISAAFDTGGFGYWAPNAYSTILRKLGSKYKNMTRRKNMAVAAMEGASGINSILIDTGQLRRAVSSKVEM